MVIPMIDARQAMIATLFNDGNRSLQGMTWWIGGTSSASIGIYLIVRGGTLSSWVSGQGGLEGGIGERKGNVLQLPHEEPEMRDDDRRAERRAGHPTGVLHKPHG